ncbi:MAG: MerR family transcriptional regulator [Propionibacteriaceae bacterium]|nr:MerR family transcriptional regulator [Propionibacteriaceae bacterium]
MHTVRWVSQQLGLSPGTLRAWEQRYGIVHPTRSEGGYRLYDDSDLETLQAMADLVAAGMQPAQAAEQIRSGRVSPSRETTRTADAPSGLPDPAALIAASRSYDARALEETLDAAFAAAGFEYVIDQWLMAALVPVGQAWAAGHLDIAQEHFISAAVMRRLTAAFAAAGHARGGRHVVTGLAPGSTHEIATLAFATMLRRAGLRVTYLGPDLPGPSWVQAVQTIHPDAVVIGASRTIDSGAATDIVQAIREAAPRTAVYVGGPGASPEQALVGTTLAEAANWLADTLTTPHAHPNPLG